MRVIFAGTPEFAVPTLEALAAAPGMELVGILTNPDAPGKRGRDLLPSPVKLKSIRLAPRTPLFQPERLDATVREQIAALNPDVLVCAAYGRIFGPKFLGLFPLGGINLHPSLLPDLRGASPIQTALLRGYTESGITVQKLALEMDAGDILVQERRSIAPDDNALTLFDRWSREGAQLVLAALEKLGRGEGGVPQDAAKASHCSRFEKSDATIDWTRRADEIWNLVRACAAGPVAHTSLAGQQLLIHSAEIAQVRQGDAQSAGQDPADPKPGQVVLVDKREGILVQTGQGLIRPLRLQLQGKSILGWRDFLNGVRGLPGTILGEGTD